MRGRGRGSRSSMKAGKSKVARRGHGGPRMSRATGGHAAFGHSGTTTPYGKGTPSIKRRDVYDALRRQGASKAKAARIANATANGTNGHRKGPLVKR